MLTLALTGLFALGGGAIPAHSTGSADDMIAVRVAAAGGAAASGRVVLSIHAPATPRYPFPRHVTSAAGTIRPDHRSQTQQDNDVRAFYDLWKTAYVVAAGTTGGGYPLYRVSFGSSDPAKTVSEGQGFGMIVTATLAGHEPAAQEVFDGLWEFSRTHPSRSESRLMAWTVPEPPGGTDSAFDGDADIAYALLLADKQWGSGGRIDYASAAGEVLAGILESMIGPDSSLPTLGDWVQPDGATYNQYTPRSSDFMTGHFRAFRYATGNTAWDEVIASTQGVITSVQDNHSPATGLLPDFIVPTSAGDPTPVPAPPYFLEGPNDGRYSYNAVRDPWRIGTDAVLGGDPTSQAQARKMSEWIRVATGGDPFQIKPGYLLDGTAIPPADYWTTIFTATLGVAAMTVPTQQQWLNDIYDAVRATHEGYYQDSVTLLCMLVMTGNFWDPSTIDRLDIFIAE
jgi:endo-1,4-beta-D-glucanase Y